MVPKIIYSLVFFFDIIHLFRIFLFIFGVDPKRRDGENGGGVHLPKEKF